MKLTNAQVLSLAKGYMTYEETPGLALQRFAPQQRAFYTEEENAFLASTFTSGIRLDFFTNSRTLDVTFGGNRRKPLAFAGFDLLQDGVLTHHYMAGFTPEEGKDAVAIDPFSIHADLKEGEKRLTLYLPYLVQTTIEELRLEDGCFFRPYDHKKTILTFGDSITAGTRAICPSMTYVNHTARLLDMDVHNYAIGGETFRKDKIVPDTYPERDLVLISYGSNEYRKLTRKEFEENMSVFLQKAAKEFQNVPIAVLLPIWRATEGEGREFACGSLQSVRDAIQAEAKKYPSMTVIDAQNWVPHIPEYFEDRTLHPNEAGFAEMTRNLVDLLKQLSF